MSAAAARAPANDAADAAKAALKAMQQAFLTEAAEMGMETARAARNTIRALDAATVADPKAATSPQAVGALAQAIGFQCRALRGMRLALIMLDRLEQGLSLGAPPRAGASPPRPAPLNPLDAVRESRKLRIVRVIGGDAFRERNDRDAVAGCVREAAERLEDDDLQDLVMTLPLADLVRMIANDVGLSANWPGLDQHKWVDCEKPRPGWNAVEKDDGPPRRETCLDRPDPILATPKGPGPKPRVTIRHIPGWTPPPLDPPPDG